MQKPFLAVFDFDNTLTNDYTVSILEKLLPTGLSGIEHTLLTSVTVDPVQLYSDLFNKLNRNGFSLKDVRQALKTTFLSPGMEQVLQYLRDHDCEAIIVSDSVTTIVDEWLNIHNLQNYFQKVYALPSHYAEDGNLEVRPYHKHSCEISYRTLCKGEVLESHINQRQSEGITFSKIGYFGDSLNDMCPILRLAENDLAFPRKNYALCKMFREKSDENIKGNKASVHPWSNGKDILEVLTKII